MAHMMDKDNNATTHTQHENTDVLYNYQDYVPGTGIRTIQIL